MNPPPSSAAPGAEAHPPLLARPIDDRLLLALFSLLFGLLAATLSGYIFGTIDHSDQLPLIFRAQDPGYLINDFFLDAESAFSVRFYYVRLVAAAGEFIAIPLLFAAIHWMLHIAVTIITAFAAKDITGSTAAGILAAGLVASLQPFTFGTEGTAIGHLNPTHFAMPFVLIALWRGIKGEALQAAAASIPAILAHPLVGVEFGCLALLAAVARQILKPRPRGAWAVASLRIKDLGAGAFVLLGATTLFWLIPASSSELLSPMATPEFLEIYVRMRRPHHLLPSTWPLEDFLAAGAFLGAVIIVFIDFTNSARLARDERASRERLNVSLTLAAVLASAIMAIVVGWIFIEAIPTQWSAIAQFFRFARVLAWLGWMLVAWSIMDMLVRKDWRWAALTLISAAAAPALLICAASIFAASRFRRGSAMRSPLFFGIVALAVILALDLATPARSALLHDVWQIGLAFAVASAATLRPRLLWAALGALLCAILAAIAVFALDRSGALPQIPSVSAYARFIQPAFTIDEYANREAGQPSTQLALAAKQATEPDAVFLIPWEWRNWRIFAERAVVADRKIFPFDRNVMREWHRRYLAIYDSGEGAGYPYDITKTKLLALQAQYVFQYAVLHGDSFSFPVIAEADDWILVRVVEDEP